MKKFETIKKFEAMETDQLQKIVGGEKTYVGRHGDSVNPDGSGGCTAGEDDIHCWSR